MVVMMGKDNINKLTAKQIKRTLLVDGVAQFNYILIEDIPLEYKKEFGEWLYGQTCPVVYDQATGKDKMAVYWHDWIRWYKFKVGKAKFLVFD